VAAELKWFFLEAAGACGIKSQAGFVEDILRSGVIPDGGTKWMDDGPTDRQVESWERARHVWARLARLAMHHRRVLELQFGTTAPCGEVSLALAADQSLAVRGHAIAMVDASAAIKKRQAKIIHGVANQKRKRKVSKWHDQLTVGGWLIWLASRGDEACADVLGRIVSAAKGDLDAALAAYITSMAEAA